MPVPAFTALLNDLLGSAPAPTRDRTDERILDAAIELIAQSGERHLTIDAVAARSGVARATIFRRCGTRDGLLAATYAREVRRAVDVARLAAADTPAVHDALAAAYDALAEHCIAHPVIQRLAWAETDGFVRLWVDGSPSGIEVVTHLLRDLALHGAPDARAPAGLDDACATLARLLLATLLVPVGGGAPEFDRGLRSRVTEVVIAGLAGEPPLRPPATSPPPR